MKIGYEHLDRLMGPLVTPIKPDPLSDAIPMRYRIGLNLMTVP